MIVSICKFVPSGSNKNEKFVGMYPMIKSVEHDRKLTLSTDRKVLFHHENFVNSRKICEIARDRKWLKMAEI